MNFLLWAGALGVAGVIGVLGLLLVRAQFRQATRTHQPTPPSPPSGDVAERRAEPMPDLDLQQREHAFTRLENHILREFVAQADPAKAIRALLRHYVADPSSGFAALIERSPVGTTCQFSRGLSEESLASIRLTEAELRVVLNAREVRLVRNEVFDSSIIAGLSRSDASKAKSLYLFAVGDAATPLGVFATTALYPAGASEKQQIELAKRLMAGTASTLQSARALREREVQLRLTTEMLELRGIADQRFDHPVGLIEAYLLALAPKVSADSAALFLFSADRSTAGSSIARCGGPDGVGVSTRWKSYEESLARLAVAVDRPRIIESPELRRYGVDALIGSVLLLPLCNDRRVVGLIVLASSRTRVFTQDDQTLAVWSTEFLAKAIPRVLSQAVIERQARQDGLTGLANRREWDVRFRSLLEEVRQKGAELTVLLCDLDRFKSVNDTFGHRAGDEALRVLSQTIRDQVIRTRVSDEVLIARYGGEEIAILLPYFGSAGALRLAEAIRATVEQTTVTVDDHSFRMTVSIGLSTSASAGCSPEELVSRADEALYHAKATGRNRVCIADRGPTPASAPMVDARRRGQAS